MIRWHDLELCCNFLDPNKEWLNVGFQSALRDMQIIYIYVLYVYSTYKNGCTAELYASVDKATCEFVVRKLVTEHNHIVSSEVYQRYPENRQMTTEEKAVRVADRASWENLICFGHESPVYAKCGGETQAGKLKFFGTHPNWAVSYIACTKFHLPRPVFHSQCRPWRPKIGLDQLNLTLGK